MDKSSLDLTGTARGCSEFQLKLLFHQLLHVSFASVIAVVFITTILWPVANHQSLLIWVVLVLTVILIRIALISFLKKNNPTDTDLKPWRMATFALIMIAGIVWGSLAFAFNFDWSAFHQFALISVLFILALGFIPAYATILPAYIMSISAVLLPISVIFLFSGVDDFPLYGA